MRIISTSISKKDGRPWATVDATSMEAATVAAYEHYRELHRQATQAREAFETAFRGELGRDDVQFGYKFGKLSIAHGDAPKAKAAPKASAGSLADFLANASAQGRRA